MCQMHTHGQFVKWLLKLCFMLWNNVSLIKLEDIGYCLMPYMPSFQSMCVCKIRFNNMRLPLSILWRGILNMN
jgi:hypothetical protein